MTIDANIIIAYLGGDDRVIETLTQWRQEGRPLFLSTVAETEILSFTQWTLGERRTTEQFIEENFVSIVFDRNVARVAADIRRRTAIKFPDAAIAATALYTNTPVVTRDQQDFKKVPGLEIVAI